MNTARSSIINSPIGRHHSLVVEHSPLMVLGSKSDLEHDRVTFAIKFEKLFWCPHFSPLFSVYTVFKSQRGMFFEVLVSSSVTLC